MPNPSLLPALADPVEGRPAPSCALGCGQGKVEGYPGPQAHA